MGGEGKRRFIDCFCSFVLVCLFVFVCSFVWFCLYVYGEEGVIHLFRVTILF